MRYARLFNGVEINSSFYKPHRLSTYERWAASVPEEFRFSVKAPKEITHQRKLIETIAPLERFLAEITGLGERLGPLLFQLPPSLAFDMAVADGFFACLRTRFTGSVVCEPRHSSWFGPEAERVLTNYRIARVAADPALTPDAALPGGWPGLAYYRLHGSPRTYYSAYSEEDLATLAQTMRERMSRDGNSSAAPIWCIFDNTALGAATDNALNLAKRLQIEITFEANPPS